jgi:glycosyltransferase involved in cell wall biosynthesis
METPRVTVICLCYNHGRFVREAIESVVHQTHPAQLVVVDDASTDGSADRICEVLKNYPEAIFLPLEKNLGNCRAFNRGFALAKGQFIIDLAADDVLMPQRAEEGIKALEAAGEKFGVSFSDAELIDEQGHPLGLHSDKFPHNAIPEGDIYKEVIKRYFINSPTMMMRREVLEALGGYDETLAYEDFDFWVRSARIVNYCYTPRPLVRRRILKQSMARMQYMKNSPQLTSTFRVCEKIMQLNETPDENKALKQRVFYEMRRALGVLELRLAIRYGRLLIKIQE